MVREVVSPRDQWMADDSSGKDFLTSMIEWEIKVAAYEVASGDRISEAVRVATNMDHARRFDCLLWNSDAVSMR